MAAAVTASKERADEDDDDDGHRIGRLVLVIRRGHAEEAALAVGGSGVGGSRFMTRTLLLWRARWGHSSFSFVSRH